MSTSKAVKAKNDREKLKVKPSGKSKGVAIEADKCKSPEITESNNVMEEDDCNDYEYLELVVEDLDAEEKKDIFDMKSFPCTICNSTFPTMQEAKEHIKSHSYFSCDTCKKVFYTLVLLKQHLKNAHKPSMNLVCRLCQKVLRTKYNLKQHLLTHSAVRTYACQFCNKKFRQISSLQEHEKIHTKQNRKECEICGQMVTKLSMHMWSHKTERPHKCNICSNRSFATKQQLRIHMEKHEGIRYDCDECKAQFGRPSSLYKHKQTVHALPSNYGCIKCDKGFNRKDNLLIHMKKVHKIQALSENMLLRTVNLEKLDDTEETIVYEERINIVMDDEPPVRKSGRQSKKTQKAIDCETMKEDSFDTEDD